jgi:predicted Zn-dependent protease with MMP-like domain
MSRAPEHEDPADLVDEGRLDEALEAYEAALREAPDDLDLLFEAADLHLNVLQEEDGDREASERGLALARRGTKRARRAGDRDRELDFAWLEGVALNQLGENREALARLAAAEALAPDALDVHLEKALALYELCRFDEARAALLRAEALGPDEAFTQHHLGLVAERRGEHDEARRRFARARRLDPDAYPVPISLPQAEFDAAVEAALAELPEQVRAYLGNVAITVEELPSEVDLLGADPPLSPSILGLFRGAPYGQKASSDPWSHLPSGIVLYQRNLERFVRSREELVEEIRVTLVHEVGHFLGLDEEELYRRGLD